MNFDSKFLKVFPKSVQIKQEVIKRTMCNQPTKRLLNEQLSIENDQLGARRNQIVTAIELEELDVD